MAAAATMMFGQEQMVSSNNDMAPDWTSKEVSTGVSYLPGGAGLHRGSDRDSGV